MEAGRTIRIGRSFGSVGAYPARPSVLSEKEVAFYNTLPEEIVDYVIVRPHFFLSQAEENTAIISPSFLFPLSTGGIIVQLHKDDVTVEEREMSRAIFEEKGLIYYDEIPPSEALMGDYLSIINSIPNVRLRHSGDDMRVVFDIYRSFDIEINSLKECGGVSFFMTQHEDGRILLKGVVKAGVLKSRSTEKVFYLCIDIDGTVHCRVDSNMYQHGMIFLLPSTTDSSRESNSSFAVLL